MAINATSTGSGNHEPIPAGNYVARCVSMIEIGTVVEEYKGEPKIMKKVRISWETPTETKVFIEEKGEQPYIVSKEFTLSLNEKANLRKFLAGWRGKDFKEEEAKCFDISVLLGKICMLSIVHKQSKNDKTYAEINSISTLPKGLTCPKQINPSFELCYQAWDEEKFETLPDFIKDKMKTSDEYKALHNPEFRDLGVSSVDTFTADTDDTDGLPF